MLSEKKFEEIYRRHEQKRIKEMRERRSNDFYLIRNVMAKYGIKSEQHFND